MAFSQREVAGVMLPSKNIAKLKHFFPAAGAPIMIKFLHLEKAVEFLWLILFFFFFPFCHTQNHFMVHYVFVQSDFACKISDCYQYYAL